MVSRYSPRVCPSRIRNQPLGEMATRRIGGTFTMHEHQSGNALPEPSTRNKKKGGRSPLLVSPSRLISLTARCFFACGLDCAWDERTRPLKEWERAIFRPTLFPTDTGMSTEWTKASMVSLGAFALCSSGPVTLAASDPCAPGCRGVKEKNLLLLVRPLC